MRWVHGRSGRASCRAWTARHGVGTAPEGPDGVGARRADHREPGEGLVGERDPPAAVREARAPVVARRVPGEQAQLPDLGLEGVGAHHPVDPLDQPDHLLDARPLVAAGEVGAHASSQVAAGADVEHLVAGPAEQVDAGLLGDGVGQVALGALDRADLDLQRQEVLERRARRGRRRARAARAGRRRWPGRRRGRGGSGACPPGRAPPGPRAGTTAPRRGTGRGARAAPCTPPPGAATTGRDAGTPRAGARRRTARCGPRAPPRRRTPAGPAGPRAAAGRPGPSPS